MRRGSYPPSPRMRVLGGAKGASGWNTRTYRAGNPTEKKIPQKNFEKNVIVTTRTILSIQLEWAVGDQR